LAEVGGLRLRLNPPCGLGIAAAARAITATVVSMLFFGWLLLIASGIEVAQAVMVGHWAGFFQSFAGGDPRRGNGLHVRNVRLAC